MNRRSAIGNLISAGAASWVSKLLHGSPSPSEDSGYTIRSEVRLVLLDVSVKDSQGSLVPGLPKESFRVIENGRTQPITIFDNRDIPVAVGILVDESRSMTPKRHAVLTAAELFIQESNPQDQIFVLNFSDTVERGLPKGELFSDNLDELRAALDRGKPKGKTALNDAVVMGVDQLEQGKREKKTLIVISDGGDNASEHTQRQMLEAVEGSVATIYTIGLFDEDDADRNPAILKRLAAVSGGEAYFPEDSAGMIPICRRIAKEIRSRYTLGYVPAPENGKGLRRVEVRVSAPKGGRLHARHRTSYRY